MGARGPKRGWKMDAATTQAVAASAVAEAVELPALPVAATPAKPAKKSARKVPKRRAVRQVAHVAVAAALAASATPAAPVAEAASAPVLTAADRENPDKLSGDALRKLAHNRGMSRSEMAHMDDAKIRVQMRYLVHRQYDTAGA